MALANQTRDRSRAGTAVTKPPGVPHQVANMITTTTAIVPVLNHPIAHNARGRTKRPITSRRIAMSMMITINGTATTPLITADQNSALIGSRSIERELRVSRGDLTLSPTRPEGVVRRRCGLRGCLDRPAILGIHGSHGRLAKMTDFRSRRFSPDAQEFLDPQRGLGILVDGGSGGRSRRDSDFVSETVRVPLAR
jgi:hypothetical protein